MTQFLKVIGILLLVILLLFVIGPWIVNVLSLEVVADAYEAYVEWVGSLFNTT